jgi:hypothetical protein
MKPRLAFLTLFTLGLALALSASQGKLTYDKYHNPEDVAALLKSWSSQYPDLTKLLNIGKSAGKRDIYVLQIAAKKKGHPEPDTRPGVLISANVEGIHLIGTEAALGLAEKLLTQYGSDKKITFILEKRTVYVAPLLNPDAARQYFSNIKWEKRSNDTPIDEDVDGLLDEDVPDDLDKNGLITQMRVKDPEGKWIPDPGDPRLMRQADAKKGETGIYKIYPEGLDNDGDGKYNEDPPGGIEINRNFPHDFEYHVKSAGSWPTSAAETIVLFKFLVSRPNIAMVLNFSTENTILNLQQTGRARSAGGKVKVPDRFAEFLGLEKGREYEIQELIDVLNSLDIFGGREVDESLIAMMLGLGPAMAIDNQDMPVIEAVQKEYKDALKEAKLDYPEKRAKGVGKGSFTAYGYFQLGVQIFSTDLWGIPEPKKDPSKEKDVLTVDKLKEMTSEDFIALGEEKIQAFLEEQGAPPNFKAAMLIKMVESGKVTPKKMVEMMEKMPQRPGAGAKGDEHPDSYILEWSDSNLDGKGFVDWKTFKHPTLGEVEIGGFIPYLRTTPPPSEIKKTANFHIDFYIDLMGRLPDLDFKEIKIETADENLFHVTAYLTNHGWFPTSTAQGRKARSNWPITVRLKTAEGQSLFSGRTVVTIPFIGGSGDVKKAEWTIRGKKGTNITITADSPKLGQIKKTVVIQ